MKTVKFLVLTYIIVGVSNLSFAQNPTDLVWGLYASGVGERLKPGMDPCWVTYTVGLTSDPKIQINVAQGSMGALLTNVNWYEATAAQRSYSRYFDDEPDGTYKLTPCEIVYPNLAGTWFSRGRGKYIITQSGEKLKGTASGININDHWGSATGYRNGGSMTGSITKEGTIIFKTEWGDGTYSEDYLTLSADGKVLSGSWNWYTNSSKSSKKGSGTYSLNR
ncbi:MAG: hypothetical protein KAI99_12420 [Cyclobacteriaceae bacterium]|nr:hypothetical protein [Cyclobacteriaceae bacterium]MCK5209635.1 hypothetical protein [Cyclobacteriaceae bacterium]MCK5278462.1 hypothetical protein [Cyclobacteriaceae bacterium]MCK5469316.1 hypothetical protein [Cyclobacteriaceae bacterium]